MIRSTFAIPILVALASIIGLVSALTGDGFRDALSWIALLIPIVAVAWAMRVKRT
jgi:hypothetical protein